jgi:hypothetical protein
LLLALRRANIAEFLEDADAKRLFMYLDAKGELTASTHPPGTYKKNQKVRVAAARLPSPLAWRPGTLTTLHAPNLATRRRCTS